MIAPYYQSDSVTLYYGDCRDVLAELPDNSVDLVATDPPYGHNNNNGDLIARREAALGRGDYQPDRDNRPIANDGHKDASHLAKWLFDEAARVLKPGCCCCCCCGGGGGPDPQFARWSLWMDGPLEFKQMVVWDKGPMGMGWHYRRSYETVLVGQKGKGKCAWFDNSRKIENIIRPGDYGIRKIIPKKTDHPTPKPVALMSHFVRLHTVEGNTVLDPFSGSGTTLLAARELGRNAIGVELSEEYCEMTAKRLDSQTELLPC